MSSPNRRITKIIYYKVATGIVVANAYFNYGSVRSTMTSNCLINDKPLMPTHNAFWYFIEGETEITSYKEKTSDSSVLKGYKLADESMYIEDKIPLTLSIEDVKSGYDEDEGVYWANHNNIRSLYVEVREVVKGEYVDVEFEAECKGVVEGDLTKPAEVKYKTIIDSSWGKQEYTDISKVAHYSELDTILTPEFALHEKPCSLTSQQTYAIIRSYVKDNIDPKQAAITSDYDFCFTVKKKVTVKPWQQSRELLTRAGRSYRPPKYKTQTVEHKLVEVFEMTHAGSTYKGYTIIKGFNGVTLEDLVNNIKAYLTELMDYINTQVAECSHCSGTGHIVDKTFDVNGRE